MTISRSIPAALALLLAVWMPAAAGAASAEELEKQFLAKIDELLPGMGAKAIEDRAKPQMALEGLCVENSTPDKQVERGALCRAIMQRVGPDVAMPARVWMLRKIEPIGRAEVVAPLTRLLADPDAQIRETARRALQNNPAPEAAAALRAELAKAQDECWTVAIINALAFRKDAEAVPQLAKLCEAKNDKIAQAAINALGCIGDDYSVQALVYLRKTARAELKGAVTDASFHAAEALIARGGHKQAGEIYTELAAADRPEHVRITALQGLAAAKGADALPELLKIIGGPDPRMQLVAARCAQSIPGQKVTQELTASLRGVSPAARAVLLEAIGKRGDKSALPAVTRFLQARRPQVRIAAIEATRYIGDASVVEPLAKIAAGSTGPDRDAARESLKYMVGRDVDERILSAAAKADARVRAELVRAAAVRLMKPALPLLLAAVNDADESVRVPVIYNIGKLATPQDLSQVLQAFAGLQASHDQAKDALVRICSRISGEAERTQPLIDILPSSQPAVQVVVLQALGSLRGQAALTTIRSSLKSPVPQVQQAAAKALADWGPIYVTEWVFAGPYKKDGAAITELFDTAFPPESDDAGVEWKPVKGQRGRDIDLQRLAKDENCCGYLRTQLISESEQEVVLTFGSDDGIKVWLNGQVIHGVNATRGLQVDQDKVKARLKAGTNTLLVKVTQGGGQWAVACGIQALVGGPPDTVKIQAQ